MEEAAAAAGFAPNVEVPAAPAAPVPKPERNIDMVDESPRDSERSEAENFARGERR